MAVRGAGELQPGGAGDVLGLRVGEGEAPHGEEGVDAQTQDLVGQVRASYFTYTEDPEDPCIQ